MMWEFSRRKEAVLSTVVSKALARNIGAITDETVTVIENVLHHVFHNHTVLHKIETELESVELADHALLDDEKLDQLPYLVSTYSRPLVGTTMLITLRIVRSDLRITPSVHSYVRYRNHDCSRHGYDLQRDHYTYWRMPRLLHWMCYANIVFLKVTISMTLADVHFDQQYFPAPRTFHPERWIGPDVILSREFDPKHCLGMLDLEFARPGISVLRLLLKDIILGLCIRSFFLLSEQ